MKEIGDQYEFCHQLNQFIMKTVIQLFGISLVLLCISVQTNAQNYWKGGTPGAETDWNNPRNWSMNHVPNWADNLVIIPDVSTKSRHYPIIKGKTDDISSLEVQGNAMLIILAKGKLKVNGAYTFNYGIANAGTIVNNGSVFVKNAALGNYDDRNGIVENSGEIAFQKTKKQDIEVVAAINQ